MACTRLCSFPLSHGRTVYLGKKSDHSSKRLGTWMPSSKALFITGEPGYGVKMLVQNSAPGYLRQTFMMSEMDSRRSFLPSPGYPKIMLKEGRTPACESLSAAS